MSKSLLYYLRNGGNAERVIDRRLAGTARGLGYFAALDASNRRLKNAKSKTSQDRKFKERQSNPENNNRGME
jgi:hypothetical protein